MLKAFAQNAAGPSGLKEYQSKAPVLQSARITLLMLALFERRAPKERIFLMVADSWSYAAPNIAWICAICEFKMHIGLKILDIRAVFNKKDEDAFLKALEGDRQRFRGLINNRY